MVEAYLYQIAHTLDGHPRRVAEHCAVFDQASHAIFGTPFPYSTTELTRQIIALLASERSHSANSRFIRMEYAPQERLRLTTIGTSLYRGYALRSLAPEAVTTLYNTPFGEHPTSAREAAAQLASAYARLQGATCAIHCTSTGVALTCDDAPLYAVKGRSVYTSPKLHSVEAQIAIQAIAAAGLTLETKPIMRDDISRFDELFYVDHRGITALSKCDEQPYMSLISERIAIAAGLIKD